MFGAKLLAAAYRSNKAYSTSTAGLFNKAQLQFPADWVTYAQDTISRCHTTLLTRGFDYR